MSKYNTRYDYVRENMSSWLKDFADKEGEKVAKQNNINPDELKNAGYMENILDIVNRKKKITVDAKVQELRERVGLDLLDNLEKEGTKEVRASRISLSIRDKVAQTDADPSKLLENINQYVSQVIANRNGSIATPALLDQIEHYMNVDKNWLRANYEQIEKLIKDAREKFHPEVYNDLSINDLARTDDPSKGEKEQAPFLPPASST